MSIISDLAAIRSRAKAKRTAIKTAANILPQAGVLAFIRVSFPDLLPWGVECDAGVVALVTTVLAPIITYIVDRFRH